MLEILVHAEEPRVVRNQLLPVLVDASAPAVFPVKLLFGRQRGVAARVSLALGLTIRIVVILILISRVLITISIPVLVGKLAGLHEGLRSGFGSSVFTGGITRRTRVLSVRVFARSGSIFILVSTLCLLARFTFTFLQATPQLAPPPPVAVQLVVNAVLCSAVLRLQLLHHHFAL